jgi:hypothetical protein
MKPPDRVVHSKAACPGGPCRLCRRIIEVGEDIVTRYRSGRRERAHASCHRQRAEYERDLRASLGDATLADVMPAHLKKS